IVVECLFLKTEINTSDPKAIASVEVRLVEDGVEENIECEVGQTRIVRGYEHQRKNGIWIKAESPPFRDFKPIKPGIQVILKDKNEKEIGRAVISEFNLTDRIKYRLKGYLELEGVSSLPCDIFKMRKEIVKAGDIEGRMLVCW
ncbi:MAG: hypothetical protein KJ879_02225, partial [Nanoarchaeota archaeon]|nr:hypothetical protein [Nanoarchaeota archaeon]